MRTTPPLLHHPIDHPGVEVGQTPSAQEILTTRADFVDVSHHQHDIDFDAYAKSGRSMAICKVTEGGDWVDDKAVTYRKDMATQGLKCGLYHFARPNGDDMEADATVEANNYLAQVGTLASNEFPVLDFEIINKLSPEQLGSWATKWCATVQEQTGKTPWIYSYTNMLPKIDATHLSQYPLWLADYRSSDRDHPPSSGAWPSLVAWQYTDKAEVPGIEGGVDGNYLYGPLPCDQPATPPSPSSP